MTQAKLFQNLINLTHLLNDNYKCELQFRINDESIELFINSLNTSNSYNFSVRHDFDVGDVLYQFKEMVVRGTLKTEVE